MNHVYVGYDPREVTAYNVCIASLRRHSGHFSVTPVSMRLPPVGPLYQRPTTVRTPPGAPRVLWDDISDKPMATEFSLARFFVPALQRNGWALFCDCDFMFRAPIEKLFALADDRYAVMVVQHDYAPRETTKMDNQPQTSYPRKNWSSLMLLNCTKLNDNDFLSPNLANNNTGFNLHTFSWLRDDLIGALPLDWNWLAGVSPHMDNPHAVHYTLGTPDMPGYEDSAFANEWREYARGLVAA